MTGLVYMLFEEISDSNSPMVHVTRDSIRYVSNSDSLEMNKDNKLLRNICYIAHTKMEQGSKTRL
jgi:hypothetical protein